jgi:hypothetical protein
LDEIKRKYECPGRTEKINIRGDRIRISGGLKELEKIGDFPGIWNME